MSEGHSPVEYDDYEAIALSRSKKGLGCRPVGTKRTGRELNWVPVSQLCPGSIRAVGDSGKLIIPLWLADQMAQEGRI